MSHRSSSDTSFMTSSKSTPSTVSKNMQEKSKKPADTVKKPDEKTQKPEENAKMPEEKTKKPEEIAKKPEEKARKEEPMKAEKKDAKATGMKKEKPKASGAHDESDDDWSDNSGNDNKETPGAAAIRKTEMAAAASLALMNDTFLLILTGGLWKPFYSDLKHFLLKANKDFTGQTSLLELEAPIIVCGDFHGQLEDLKTLFHMHGPPPLNRFLFLGEYVDRCAAGMEVMNILFCYKMLYPKHIYLLRGNHEVSSTNDHYGFYQEISYRFAKEMEYNSIWHAYNDVFDLLPISATSRAINLDKTGTGFAKSIFRSVGKRILCMHGGLSEGMKKADIAGIRMPLIRDNVIGHAKNVLWSDPLAGCTGYKRNEERRSGQIFGPDAVENACKDLAVDCIIRAHQAVGGIKFFANRKVFTIFSASNYEEGNAAGCMVIDQKYHCSVLAWTSSDPRPAESPEPPTTGEMTPPDLASAVGWEVELIDETQTMPSQEFKNPEPPRLSKDAKGKARMPEKTKKHRMQPPVSSDDSGESTTCQTIVRSTPTFRSHDTHLKKKKTISIPSATDQSTEMTGTTGSMSTKGRTPTEETALETGGGNRNQRRFR